LQDSNAQWLPTPTGAQVEPLWLTLELNAMEQLLPSTTFQQPSQLTALEVYLTQQQLQALFANGAQTHHSI
jgi:hypothetical protein